MFFNIPQCSENYYLLLGNHIFASVRQVPGSNLMSGLCLVVKKKGFQQWCYALFKRKMKKAKSKAREMRRRRGSCVLLLLLQERQDMRWLHSPFPHITSNQTHCLNWALRITQDSEKWPQIYYVVNMKGCMLLRAQSGFKSSILIFCSRSSPIHWHLRE